MPTLLLELFSEEIPSRMQKGGAEQLERLITAGCAKARLTHGAVKAFVSPRHLAVTVAGLPDAQPDVSEEKKGPRVDAPVQALDGFFKSAGIPQESAEVREIGGAKYFFAVIHRKGRPTAEVAKEICESALAAFTWPKSMRWGAHELQWVRPLHRITCLLDKHVVPVTFGHLTASNVTEGHRFLSPGALTLHSAADYEEKLKAAHVLVDFATRREWIKGEVAKLAEQHSLSVIPDEALLDEVTGLVEWPQPLFGRFDKSFLTLPPEVLISEMKVHQRYFALADKSGKLADGFIAVANMTTKDDGKQVIAGNERVLRARLADGAFYWEQDKKTKLEDWGKKLEGVVFHAKVGMMNEKVARINALATRIANTVSFKDVVAIGIAANLCKADLTSSMVGEFPELQGIMGRYYYLQETPNLLSDQQNQIADAIRDHYKPLGPNDSLPVSKLAAIVALADKLDSIISLFAAGEKPTGSKDPFALRRAALGALRIIIQNGFSLDLSTLMMQPLLFSLVHSNIAEQNRVKASSEFDVYKEPYKASAALLQLASEATALGEMIRKTRQPDARVIKFIDEILEFFHDRLKNTLRDEGLRHDIVEASLATRESGFNPVLISGRAKELAAWVISSDGTAAFAAIKRPINILEAEEKKAKAKFSFDEKKLAALSEPAEKDLLKALKAAKPARPADLNALTAPINQFFDKVLVNAEDKAVREARLSLLAGIRENAQQIADFSKIEG